MNKKIILIEELIHQAQELENDDKRIDYITMRVKMIIGKFFGEESKYLKQLSSIRFKPSLLSGTPPRSAYLERFNGGRDKLVNLLRVMKEELLLDVYFNNSQLIDNSSNKQIGANYSMNEMERKFQVFISSTYTDLIKERETVVMAVLDAEHIPAGMELFKSGRSTLITIYKWIDDSDIFVLLLGGRYGSVEPESGKSYTQLEYEYAVSKKMPVLTISLTDAMLDGKIQTGIPSNEIYEKENPHQYKEFKALVNNNIFCPAKNLDEIKIAVLKNIKSFEKEYVLRGWVRYNGNTDYEKLQKENNNLKAEIERLKSMRIEKKFIEEDWKATDDGYSIEVEHDFGYSPQVSTHKEDGEVFHCGVNKTDKIVRLSASQKLKGSIVIS